MMEMHTDKTQTGAIVKRVEKSMKKKQKTKLACGPNIFN